VLAARVHAPEARPLLGAIGLVCLSLWAGYWMHGKMARHLMERGEAWTGPAQALANYAQAFRRDDQITSLISVNVPLPRVSLAADPDLYYGNLDVLIPEHAPFDPRETLDSFKKRVLEAGIDLDHCGVDFSHLTSKENLSEIIDAHYRAGFTKFDRVFDSALADQIRKIFRASTFVPCREFLKDEPWR
jgi:hypothetical protein